MRPAADFGIDITGRTRRRQRSSASKAGARSILCSPFAVAPDEGPLDRHAGPRKQVSLRRMQEPEVHAVIGHVTLQGRIAEQAAILNVVSCLPRTERS